MKNKYADSEGSEITGERNAGHHIEVDVTSTTGMEVVQDVTVESNPGSEGDVENLHTKNDVDIGREFSEQAYDHAAVGGGPSLDIFSADTSSLAVRPSGNNLLQAALVEGENPHLQSNWDDGEGYYKARVGELICDRYHSLGVIGKGVFSTVIRCTDTRDDNKRVAIKMIRNNDTMRKAAEKELSILTQITKTDVDGRKHCVRILDHSEFRNHVIFVFENLRLYATSFILCSEW